MLCAQLVHDVRGLACMCMSHTPHGHTRRAVLSPSPACPSTATHIRAQVGNYVEERALQEATGAARFVPWATSGARALLRARQGSSSTYKQRPANLPSYLLSKDCWTQD